MDLDKFFEETDFESALTEAERRTDAQEEVTEEQDCAGCKL